MKPKTPIPVLKSRAKKLRNLKGVSFSAALDEVARSEGFLSWSHLASVASADGCSGEIRQTITSLPLNAIERIEFVKLAGATFEVVFNRIEPDNPARTRALWDAERYIDIELPEILAKTLPISRSYALSLIEAFLVHHVIGLATEADAEAAEG